MNPASGSEPLDTNTCLLLLPPRCVQLQRLMKVCQGGVCLCVLNLQYSTNVLIKRSDNNTK